MTTKVHGLKPVTLVCHLATKLMNDYNILKQKSKGKNENSQPRHWLSDDTVSQVVLYVGPVTKMSQRQKFKDENGHFHSLRMKRSFRQ